MYNLPITHIRDIWTISSGECFYMNIKVERILRSKRKTIALHMTDNATLIIKAPIDASDNILKGVVLKHKKWIEQKYREIKTRYPKSSQKEFIKGESFLYMGKYYILNIVEKQKTPLIFSNGFYLSKNSLEKAKALFILWYRQKAYEIISECVQRYSQETGLKYNKINITSAKKRWGSCSSAATLNFTWRLVMAPLPVIDYIAIHELVHIKIRNHSKIFWDSVSLFMPNYKKHQEWLKKYGYLMTLY